MTPDQLLARHVLLRAMDDALQPGHRMTGNDREKARAFCIVSRRPGMHALAEDDPAYWREFWCVMADIDESSFVEAMRRKIERCILRETVRASSSHGGKTSPTSSPTLATSPTKAPVFW